MADITRGGLIREDVEEAAVGVHQAEGQHDDPGRDGTPHLTMPMEQAVAVREQVVAVREQEMA